ncbi:MAG: CDP-diacylglycerol--glycerol-3-phosphate 3-phosphatidyltransferase [Candidatus Hydrogenedens sp.]|nr:CDP-diacylglycerol--glycerol-3-phosphate 3-phosphatidyltransferase [Candidatus Hydrogenedens sp.]
MNLPNQLTVVRCIMALLYMALMSFEGLWPAVGALLMFIAAAITDYLDGNIARARGLVTNFGKLMDPLADKILMVAAFVMMMPIPYLWIPGWTIVVILSREFVVTGMRSLAASEGEVLAAIHSGKTKTVLQIAYVVVFMAVVVLVEGVEAYPSIAEALPCTQETLMRFTGWSSLGGILAVTAVTVYSGIEFARVNWSKLHLDNL